MKIPFINRNVKLKKPKVADNLTKGRWVSLRFFKRHGWIIMFAVISVLALQGLRYKTRTSRMEIKQLQQELNEAEHAKIEAKAEYMSLIREKEMVESSGRHGLGLGFGDEPPYVLTLDDK